MNNKLAKQLKDAGFPFEDTDEYCHILEDGNSYISESGQQRRFNPLQYEN